MKKIFCIALMLLSCSCIALNDKPQPINASQKTEVFDINKALRELNAHGVIVKKSTKEFVIYQYRNISVAKIAPVAMQYCGQYGKKAYLNDIVQTKLNERIATFDCFYVSEK